jgi:hypothetical protein
MGPIKPKFDHYNVNMFLDDPDAANLKRKKRWCPPKFGTEPRIPPTALASNPGPAQYSAKDKPELVKLPQYSFGFRRYTGHTNNLIMHNGTPIAVGPGRYMPETSRNPSTKLDFPRWSLPKEGRMPPPPKKHANNESYDMRKHFGRQMSSKHRTATCTHFGTSERDLIAREGIFKDQWTGTVSQKLYHAVL